MGHSNWNYSGKASDSPSTQSSGKKKFLKIKKNLPFSLSCLIGSESVTAASDPHHDLLQTCQTLC